MLSLQTTSFTVCPCNLVRACVWDCKGGRVAHGLSASNFASVGAAPCKHVQAHTGKDCKAMQILHLEPWLSTRNYSHPNLRGEAPPQRSSLNKCIQMWRTRLPDLQSTLSKPDSFLSRPIGMQTQLEDPQKLFPWFLPVLP